MVEQSLEKISTIVVSCCIYYKKASKVLTIRKEARSCQLDRTESVTLACAAEVGSRGLRTQSSLMISCGMEHALLVLVSDFSHVVVLIVGWSPAMGYVSFIGVLSAVEHAHCC